MIKENDIVSYKELCKQLNIPYYSGKQKILQLNNLKRYYDYEKVGTKYLIKKIYDTPMLKTNGNAITLNDIRFILLNVLSHNDYNNEHYFASNKDLLRLCYIINNNYYSILTNKDRNSMYITSKYNFDDSFIEYINNAYSVLKPVITGALESMVKRKEILLGVGYKLRKNGVVITAVSANSPLGKEIFNIQGTAMKTLGVEKYSDLWGKYINKKQEYFDLCDILTIRNSKENPLWIENGWDFEGFYQCYEIIRNVDKIRWDLDELIKTQTELNGKIKNKLKVTKLLKNLSNNEIDKYFYILNTTNGDSEYGIVEDIKKLK